jgi:hypothetical protein
MGVRRDALPLGYGLRDMIFRSGYRHFTNSSISVEPPVQIALFYPSRSFYRSNEKRSTVRSSSSWKYLRFWTCPSVFPFRSVTPYFAKESCVAWIRSCHTIKHALSLAPALTGVMARSVLCDEAISRWRVVSKGAV